MNTKVKRSKNSKPVDQLTLSEQEQKQLLNWLGEGLDSRTVAILFRQEFNRDISEEAIVRLWVDNSKKLHLDRRNYFARVAETLVDNRFTGEAALDSANRYLLKQALFEALIEQEKNPKKIESLIKAIKQLNCNPTLNSAGEKKDGAGESLSDEALKKIEEVIRIL